MFADQCGLAIDYRAIEATAETFPQQVSELAAGGARGCNITVPLKQDAWKLADRCSDSAGRARAANTLVFQQGGELYAHNTDGKGLISDLLSRADFQLAGSRICIVGAGGAAAGILGAVLRAGPDCVILANRTVERAVELAETHSDLGALQACALDAIAPGGPYDLVINATSLGHKGDTLQVDRSWFTAAGFCYDLNYGKSADPLRQSCTAQGVVYSDGLGMLVGQAALSFALWTGHSPDAAPVLDQLRGKDPTTFPSSS
jgi:shikimate dehydrogenase